MTVDVTRILKKFKMRFPVQFYITEPDIHRVSRCPLGLVHTSACYIVAPCDFVGCYNVARCYNVASACLDKPSDVSVDDGTRLLNSSNDCAVDTHWTGEQHFTRI